MSPALAVGFFTTEPPGKPFSQSFFKIRSYKYTFLRNLPNDKGQQQIQTFNNY